MFNKKNIFIAAILAFTGSTQLIEARILNDKEHLKFNDFLGLTRDALHGRAHDIQNAINMALSLAHKNQCSHCGRNSGIICKPASDLNVKIEIRGLIDSNKIIKNFTQIHGEILDKNARYIITNLSTELLNNITVSPILLNFVKPTLKDAFIAFLTSL